MARPTINARIDFGSLPLKRKFMMTAGVLEGMYDVRLKPVRDTRSIRANAFYWAAVVTPFFELLSSQEPSVTQPEQAHIELKRQVLGTRAGRVGKAMVRIMPTTHDMDTAAFADYVERARHWLREQVGIETLDPKEYGVGDDRRMKQKQPTRRTAADAAAEG
jgi:hypothetical protein